ncbi:MAG: hypothetical protein LBB56_00960, partial [Chitinispirillales bacterium]|nr:hypothetical protein [Chitinispirillales bacterium]
FFTEQQRKDAVLILTVRCCIRIHLFFRLIKMFKQNMVYKSNIRLKFSKKVIFLLTLFAFARLASARKIYISRPEIN